MFFVSSMFDSERRWKVMYMLKGMHMRITTTLQKGVGMRFTVTQ
jgi:hypothetical protein